MGTLNIESKRWQLAKEFFDKNKGSSKLSKKENPELGCSFIKIDDVIYAMANGDYIGEGGFSKVKIVETEQGQNHVVKIEGKGIDHRTLKEIAAMQKLGKFIGIMERPLPQEIDFWKGRKQHKHMTQSKTYKIVLKEEGIELHDLIYRNPAKPLNTIQKLIIAIRICQVLEQIHNKGVIHADLKPDNMLATINGNDIQVAILDFGFSIIIDKTQTMVIDEAKGTIGYIAPEIYNKANPELSKREFSFASDIYALGIIFKNNLKLDSALSEKMLAVEPQNRPTLKEIKAALAEALALQPDLDQTANQVITVVKNQLRPLPLPTAPKRALPTPILPATTSEPAATKKGTSKVANYVNQLEILLTSQKPAAINSQPVLETPIMHSSLYQLRTGKSKMPCLEEFKERMGTKENNTLFIISK